MPVSAISAEASYHRSSDLEIAEYLTSMGVKNSLVLLEELGIRGNGQMMMLERNSTQIAAALIGSSPAGSWNRRRPRRPQGIVWLALAPLNCGQMDRAVPENARSRSAGVMKPSASRAMSTMLA
jgi:hypothetical protein